MVTAEAKTESRFVEKTRNKEGTLEPCLDQRSRGSWAQLIVNW